MKLIKELSYTKSHEWVKWIDETTALVGISDHAQAALGDIVFINLPAVGDVVTVGTSFGDVESVKAVSEVYSPVTGIVSKINETLLDEPEKVNTDAYGSWFMEVNNITAKDKLLTDNEYAKIIEE